MEQKKKFIVDFLTRKYKAKVIILVGSRAVGDHKPNSDWDIYVFSDKECPKETPQEFYNSLPKELKNEHLDVYQNSTDTKTYSDKLYRDLRNSEILLDSNNFGEKLRKKALEIYKKGPEKWTKEYAQGRFYKAERYMKKFEDILIREHYPELFLRICSHYEENLIPWWFGIRNKFQLRPQQAFPYINEKDPKFYNKIEILTSDKTNYRDKINAIKEMHKLLFESKEFKRLIK